MENSIIDIDGRGDGDGGNNNRNGSSDVGKDGKTETATSQQSQYYSMQRQREAELRQWTAEEKDNECNLVGVIPKVNMPLEIRDPDFIWSAARIVNISYDDMSQTSVTKRSLSSKDHNENDLHPEHLSSDNDDIKSVASLHSTGSSTATPSCQITVRYEGWGTEWDETLYYPHPRLARIYTYTKKVKCFVELMSKKKIKMNANIVKNSGKPGINEGGKAGGKKGSKSFNNVTVKNWTDLWPCKVSFRMPHPSSHKPFPTQESHLLPQHDPNQRSELFLRLENNIFIEPYAPECLPSYLRSKMTHGGWWLNANKLRLWKDLGEGNLLGGCVWRSHPITPQGNDTEPQSGSPNGPLSNTHSAGDETEYHLHKQFFNAYQSAQKDKWIRHYLPPKVLLEGSLVVEWHRVKNLGGDPIDGVRYTGGFDMNTRAHNRKCSGGAGSTGGGGGPKVAMVPSKPSAVIVDGKKARSQGSSPIPSSDSNTNESSTMGGLPGCSRHNQAQNDCNITASNESIDAVDALSAPPPPHLPPPIIINDVTYPDRGVRRLPYSNRWVSTVRMGGNDVFLGSFVSQTEAVQAARLALNMAKENLSCDEIGEKEGKKIKVNGGVNRNFVHMNDCIQSDQVMQPDDGARSDNHHISNISQQSTIELISQVTDMLSLSIESIVSAMEEQYKHEIHKFCLHDWVMQYYRFRQSLQQQQKFRIRNTSDTSTVSAQINHMDGKLFVGCGSRGQKRKKQANPKRLFTTTT